ncbi:MAG: VPLPA-CTERM sorting domain-containing protein [Gammaproteobacteria bacterium]
MNLKLISALAAVGLMSAAPAFSETVTLKFDGASSFQSLDGFYSGGTDTGGASGTNYGISFGLDAQALANSDDESFYSNAPSPGAVMTINGTESLGSTSMNAVGGLSLLGQMNFFYSLTDTTTVSAWSGLNGTGTKLGEITLASNGTIGGCADSSSFCIWTAATLSWDGLAKSIQFGDAYGKGGFDDVSVNAVPLPAAGWLLMSALGGIGAWRRKRAAA